MEKPNFKHKKDNVIISEPCFLKVPHPENNLYFRTDETPNHTVETKDGKSFLQPVIPDSETKSEVKETVERPLESEQEDEIHATDEKEAK